MSRLEWRDIASFLSERVPDFSTHKVGVDRGLVEEAAADLGVELPELYIDMMADIGVSSGSYAPFGRSVDARFAGLRALHPPRSYPQERYFKVARYIASQVPVELQGLDPEEPFLDLTRSDGCDAPLITIDQAGAFRSDHVRNLHETLSACLARNVFIPFALKPLRNQATFFADVDGPDDAPGLEQEAYSVLSSMGYALAMPRTSGFTGLRTEQRAACAYLLDGDTLVIQLASDEDLHKDVERFTKAMPAAERKPA